MDSLWEAGIVRGRSRMDIVSWNNLGMWRDKLQARKLARNDLRPYLEEPLAITSLRGHRSVRVGELSA